jgi:hypothetical protein
MNVPVLARRTIFGVEVSSAVTGPLAYLSWAPLTRSDGAVPALTGHKTPRASAAVQMARPQPTASPSVHGAIVAPDTVGGVRVRGTRTLVVNGTDSLLPQECWR